MERTALDGLSLDRIKFLHQRMMSTFAKPVKVTTNNFLEDVKTWWNVETYGPRAPTEDQTNNDDDKALRILAEPCRNTDDGRYETGLLW